MTASSLRETLERGVNAHRAGRTREALTCYRAALAIAPNDAEAISLCGLALLHLGETEEGLTRLTRAVELEPHQAGLRMNLVEGLEKTKDYDRAMSELRILAAANPADVRALERTGDVCALTGDTDGAVIAWLRAYSLRPAHIGPALKASQSEVARGQFERALGILDSVAAQQPNHAGMCMLRCEALIARWDWQGLRMTATAWTRADPSSHHAWRMAGRAAFEQGFHVEAAAAFARVLQLVTPTAADLAAYASLCLHALDIDAAAKALDDAEALEPDHTETLSTRALLLMYLGRFDEAEAYCRRCLARDPACVPAYSTLSRVQRGHLEDADLAAVTGIALRHVVHLDRRIPAAFAAARGRDARSDHDAAFAAYEYAHQLALERDALEGRRYDSVEIDARTERLIRSSATSFPDAVRVAGAPRPLFVVGMPRSGTTLIEGVLGAHSRVFACGERPTMQQILRVCLALDGMGKVPDAETCREWSAAYFRDLPNLRGADHVTDKHPLNFEAVALIARLFPDAVIINVCRDPVETCLSIYCQEFNKHWVFAHRLADISHYYGQYARLVAHWKRTLPDRFVTIQYEDFVENFERAAPALVQACGLVWEPQCLQFQSRPRAIATFSTVQVRDPIRLGERRAERYAKHLEPLLAGLKTVSVYAATG